MNDLFTLTFAELDALVENGESVRLAGSVSTAEPVAILVGDHQVGRMTRVAEQPISASPGVVAIHIYTWITWIDSIGAAGSASDPVTALAHAAEAIGAPVHEDC